MIVPKGFSEVTPYLFVEDANAVAEFAARAFGTVEVGRTVRETGEVANLQIKFNQSIIMISESSAHFPPMPTALYLYVDDADASYKRAIDAGAVSVFTVDEMPYGDRQGGVQDPFGNYWWLSQRLSDQPYHPA